MQIRAFAHPDRAALYEIALLTGNAGGDATGLHAHPNLIGDIYAVPYAVLEPQFAFVAEDARGVAGYIVGTADTRTFEAKLETAWWPRLRKRYPDPAGDPKAWNADQLRSYLIHHPYAAPADVVEGYPAHLHMNLHPRAQGKGLGTRLLGAWLDHTSSLGVPRIHLGSNAKNERANAFWSARGFTRLERPHSRGRSTVWFGRGPPDTPCG